MAAPFFPGGLTQTDWFGLGTGTVGTAATGLSYNLSCYLNNVSMRQAQMYQEKNYHLSWAAIARNDIRSMMNITVTRLQNYTLVATLVVGMVWSGLTGHVFREDVPHFIVHAFWVSMCLSIMYFALSIAFAVKGQNSAFQNTMSLLTWECRPENPARYDHDYMTQAQQFERQGLGSMFRLPGMSPRDHEKTVRRSETQLASSRRKQDRTSSRSNDHAATNTDLQSVEGESLPTILGAPCTPLQRRIGAPAIKRPVPVPSRASPTVAAAAPPSKPANKRKAAQGSDEPLEEIRPRTRQLIHLARFAHFMQLWQPFDSQAKHCINLGLLTLLQGGMYFSLAMITTGDGFTGGLSAVKAALVSAILMVVFMYIIMTIYESGVKFKFAFTKWSIMLLFCSAPAAAYFAAVLPEPAWAWKVLAPTSCLLHCALFVVGYIQSFAEMKLPSETTQKFITGPDGQRFTEYSSIDPEVGRTIQRASDEFDLQGVTSPEHEALATRVRDSARKAVRRSMLLASVIWFCVFLADLRDSLRRGDTIVISSAELHEIPLTWNFDTVWPHKFVYAGGVAFAANEYQVFRIDFLENDSGGYATMVSCALERTIADITAKCNELGVCQPLVLLDGEGPAEIVNCATQEQHRFAGAAASSEGPSLLALRAEASLVRPLDGPLLAVLGNDVVEYTWQIRGNTAAWHPEGMRLQVSSTNLLSMDYEGGRLYAFEQPNSVNIVDLDAESDTYLESLGRWTLAKEAPALAAGSAAGPNTVYLLPRGPAPNLLRWSPPL